MIISNKHIYTVLGVNYDHLKKWRQRGHITSTGQTLDMSLPENDDFFRAQCDKKGIPYSKLVPVAKQRKIQKAKTEAIKTNDDDEVRPESLSQKKQKTEIKLNLIKIEKEKIDLAKKKGEVIEVESSHDIMQIVVSEFQNGNREDFKLLIDEICEAHEVPHEKIVSYQKRVDESMNRRAKTVKQIISAEIGKSIDEYRIKLGRGEHS